MIDIPNKENSLWTQSLKGRSYPGLEWDISIDVAVIGGGIAGLTAAYLLANSGKSVAVIEKDRVGRGVTGHTTGKITSQHGLCYAEMEERLGEDDARIYGRANEAALALVKDIIKKEKIDCDLQEENNYVFSENDKYINKFKREAETAERIGLPAKFLTKTPLPFPVKAAVRFSNQAKFHPGKYLNGLSRVITEKGGQIYETTKAKHIKGDSEVTVQTDGGTIRAKDLIIATNVPYPWLAHGYYCALEYPLKSYIIACRTKQLFKGMYITPGRLPYSILPVSVGDEKFLLVGGRSHVPGLNISAKSRFQTLADYASTNFDIESVDYIWSARDYLGYDSKPLAGKLYPWSKHIYVSTGFMKWGLTNATASAMILHDMIMAKPNPAQKIFDPARFKAVSSIPHATAKYFS